MQKLIKKLLITIIFILPIFSFGAYKNYHPNPGFNENVEKIQENFIKLKASANANITPPKTIFSEIKTLFNTISPYIKKANHKIVIQVCENLANKLYNDFSWSNYLEFEGKCIKAFQDVLYELNNKYSVKVKINATPRSGPAPLSVTFDARQSYDPSGETISKDNIFWYYTDVNGIERFIGKGFSINHTFDEPGVYIVHVTVRSINKNTKGILDGSASIEINVGERIGEIIIYANGKKLSSDYETKFSSQEANDGIIFDLTATKANGARKIVEYNFQIKGINNNFSFSRSGKGSPKIIIVPIKQEGIYTVSLTIKDNTGETLKKEFDIIISDPIAFINISPKKGDTTTTFNFDARGSYSIKSKIKTYRWTIYKYKKNGGDIFLQREGEKFSIKFPTPGTYKISLTVEDENGKKNTDFKILKVDSAPPIANFYIKPLQKWEKPSQFILDASASYDPDMLNGSDNLTYQWEISNNQNIKISKLKKNNEKVLLTVNKPGEYIIKLTVYDKYGKTNSITKKIKVVSTLRPQIIINPIAGTVLGKFNIEVIELGGKPISYYEYDLGDGTIIKTTKNKIQHYYKKAGIYTIKVTVGAPSGETNSVISIVYVGEKDKPIPVFEIKKGNEILRPLGDCAGNKAYIIERFSNIYIDASKSLNTQGIPGKDLTIYFKFPNKKIKYDSKINFRPDELGCTYIDLYVQQQGTTKISKTRIWFKVENASPTLQSLLLSFPQYGNQYSVNMNFNQKQNSDIFQENFDPIIVRVEAKGPTDPDGPGGNIAYFVWYYFEGEDPENIKEIKITPGNIPYISFALPRIAGKYQFGVKLVDIEGKTVDARDILSGLPTVVIPRDNGNPEIPLIESFEVYPSIAEINSASGAKVTFKVKAKIFTNQKLFEKNKVIKIDVDGDGIYDITTKKNKIIYYYKKPGIYRPKVKVIYKNYSSTKFAKEIEIKNGLQPNFLYDKFDKYFIVKDISLGNITKRQFCLDIKKCKKEKKYIIKNKKFFKFIYPEYGKKIIKLTVIDEKNALEKSKADIINVTSGGNYDIKILSIPNLSKNNEIYVGKQLDYEILFYIISNKKKKIGCYLDPDITKDEDGDGNPVGDKIIYCNELVNYKYNPISPYTYARLYIKGLSGDQITKDIKINFLDVQNILPENLIKTYNKLSNIINQLDSNDENERYLKDLLIQLQNTLDDKIERDAVILQLKEYIDETINIIWDQNEEKQKLLNEIKNIIKEFSSKEISNIIYGGDDYERLKDEIILTFPIEYQEKIQKIFQNIESRNIDIKQGLIQILEVAKQLVEKNILEKTEFDIIKANSCDILNIYNIPSQACGTKKIINKELIENQTDNNTDGGNIFGKIFKIILIIFGIGIILFVGIIIFFAIKAKKQMQDEEENEE